MSDYAKLAGESAEYIATLLPHSCVEHAAMLRDIRDGRLVVVPAVPTEAMLDAHYRAYHGGKSTADAYRAMLAASQEKP